MPLNTPVTFDRTKQLARTVALTIEKHSPGRVVRKMTCSRTGKVLIDWSQNDEHKTTVCPYSLRAAATDGVRTGPLGRNRGSRTEEGRR